MNTYEIEGEQYTARNEYDAVKRAYRMALRYRMDSYLGHETWLYIAEFWHGRARIIVKKVSLENEGIEYELEKNAVRASGREAGQVV